MHLVPYGLRYFHITTTNLQLNVCGVCLFRIILVVVELHRIEIDIVYTVEENDGIYLYSAARTIACCKYIVRNMGVRFSLVNRINGCESSRCIFVSLA